MPTINKGHKKKYTYHKSGRNILSSNIYNTTQWKKLRESYISEHPLCEMCLKHDIITPAEEVHHIKPILTGKDELEMKDLAFDGNNLMSLCKSCHHKLHQEMNKNKSK